MTICVGVQVNECLVFAADSAVTLDYGQDTSGVDVINVLTHGNKVFNLHRDLPICAMFCGLGNIGSESIASLAKDLRVRLMEEQTGLDPNSYTIEEVAKRCRTFLFDEKFAALAEKPKKHDLRFYVGGYSSGAATPERWLINLDATSGNCADPTCDGNDAGLSWAGQPEAINRLVMGISMNVAGTLKSAGLDAGQIKAVMTNFGSLQAGLVHPAMPVQDAIDLADFLVETTKRFVRFLPGADTVGGDTDICVVTKHEGFKWVRRKHYFNAVLNPAEVSYGSRYPIGKGKHGNQPNS